MSIKLTKRCSGIYSLYL